MLFITCFVVDICFFTEEKNNNSIEDTVSVILENSKLTSSK